MTRRKRLPPPPRQPRLPRRLRSLPVSLPLPTDPQVIALVKMLPPDLWLAMLKTRPSVH
jgi:hypothetical protein